jgi:hypothetical protein
MNQKKLFWIALGCIFSLSWDNPALSQAVSFDIDITGEDFSASISYLDDEITATTALGISAAAVSESAYGSPVSFTNVIEPGDDPFYGDSYIIEAYALASDEDNYILNVDINGKPIPGQAIIIQQ